MESLHSASEFFKVLANPSRVQILKELRFGELNVSELRNRLRMELPNVSQQLAVLRAHRLVMARKHGNNIFYSCLNHEVFKILDSVDLLIANAGTRRSQGNVETATLEIDGEQRLEPVQHTLPEQPSEEQSNSARPY